jgi:hypothetical protein
MKVYTVYKTTNIVNNKYYIGVHKTANPNDDYLGSGTVFKLAIKKYGKQNFKKEVLFVFDDLKDAYEKEYELVNEAFVKCEDNYNLHIGGSGGLAFEYINNDVEFRKAKNRKAQAAMIATGYYKTPEHKAKMSELRKQEYKEGKRVVNPEFPNAFKGKKHSEETLRKMSESSKGVTAGEKNSQFGTRWCNDGVNNIKISKGGEIPEGYHLGKVKLAKEQRKPRIVKSQKKHDNYDFGAPRRKATIEDIKIALLKHDKNINDAMVSLGYKANSSGNSRYRFEKVLKALDISTK